MKRLAIIGAGELGKQILNLSLNNPEFVVVGFFDDTIATGTTITHGYKVIGTISDILALFNTDSFDSLVIAVGYNHMNARKSLFDTFSPIIPFATIIHSSCIIDSTAVIGPGTVLYQGCIIDRNVVIQDNVLLNLGVVVSHDSEICSHCFIAPRAVLSGFVTIHERCFIGTAAVVIDNITVHSSNIVGAGTLVNKDLTEKGVYVGNPVRKIR